MFQDDGTVIPISVVEAEPNVVIQIRNTERDGYEAVQVGFGLKKKASKPLKGHTKELGNFALLKEFKTTKINDQDLKVGDKIDVSAFSIGDKVSVTGISKGKGYAGVMKRHGFHGMPFSHGHHHVARHGGSIGQRFPQHTLKGMRMSGRMGTQKVTTRGLKIVDIDIENKLIAIKGAIPGNKGSVVSIVSK
jgi:large subunit ribosomal protein L3